MLNEDLEDFEFGDDYVPAEHAVIWARVSTEDQKKEGYSLSVQGDKLQKYCDHNNLTILATFSYAESSTQGNRKHFHEMIEFIEKQKERVAIVCDKVDRFQRTFKEIPLVEPLIKSGKIELHFPGDNLVINQVSPSTLINNYHSSVLKAEGYVTDLSYNVKKGFLGCAKEGKYPHWAPVGYKNSRDENNKATLIEDPERGCLVRKIFKEFATGTYSLAEIVRYADKIGFNTKGKAKKVYTQTIRFMLSNNFYCGYMKYHGRTIRHAYVHLIDKDTFDKCQAILAKRVNTKKHKHEDIYRGLIKCARCGGNVTPDVKGKYHYLKCVRCKDSHVTETIFDAEVQKVLARFAKLSENSLNESIKYIEAALKQEKQEDKEYIRSLKYKLTNIATSKDTLLNALIGLGYEKVSITQEIYNKKMEELQKLEDKIKDELSNYSDLAQKSLISLKDLILVISKLPEIYQSSTYDEKRKFLNLMFSNIELDGKNCLFSIRKPIEKVLSIGCSHVWQGQ